MYFCKRACFGCKINLGRCISDIKVFTECVNFIVRYMYVFMTMIFGCKIAGEEFILTKYIHCKYACCKIGCITNLNAPLEFNCVSSSEGRTL